MMIGIAQRALHHASFCGDQCAWWLHEGRTFLCMVDGLGSGEGAQIAALAALDYVARHLSAPLVDIFAGCDRALRRTYGAAMGIAVVNETAGTLTYAGIGNIRAIIAGRPRSATDEGKQGQPTRGVRHLSTFWGIVGGGYKTLRSETVPLAPGDLVILFTDGLSERLAVSGYRPSLLGDVDRLAEKLIQDWRQGADDAAVMVYKSGDQ